MFPNGPNGERAAGNVSSAEALTVGRSAEWAETFFASGDLGYLIFIPPSYPALQPVELFWAHSKNYVASVFREKRTIEEMWRQLRERR